MSTKKIEIGDVVRLKSGGPAMTVAKVEGKEIACVWFDGKTQRADAFPSVCLELEDESE